MKMSDSFHSSELVERSLPELRDRLLRLGAMVESVVADATHALVTEDGALGTEVVRRILQIRGLNAFVNNDCRRLIDQQTPDSHELNQLLAMLKIAMELEHIGDEVERISRLTSAISDKVLTAKGTYIKIRRLGEHVQHMLHDALDSFARADAPLALKVTKEDTKVDHEYAIYMRRCVGYLIQDKQTATRALDLLWLVRSMERIGGHSRNVSEHVMYLLYGEYVGHINLIDRERLTYSPSDKAPVLGNPRLVKG